MIIPAGPVRLTSLAWHQYDAARPASCPVLERSMPLLLTNSEVAAAMRAHEYVETMEQAFRELGAGRAVNSLRVDSCVPLDGYTHAIKRSTEAHIDELPLDADPVYAPSTIAAAKQTQD